MDINRGGQYRFSLIVEPVGNRFKGFILRINQALGEPEPRTAQRYDLPGTFASRQEAHDAAFAASKKLVSGELSAAQPSVKKRIKEYELLASATFQIQAMQWEPTLRIESKRAQNKGAVQEFNDPTSPLVINTRPTAQNAIDYALWYGERLVTGMISGLRI